MFIEYALLKDNVVTCVINYNFNSEETLEEILSRFSYDEIVDCSKYQDTHFYTGKEKVKDKFRDVQPYPSWSYDYETNMWYPPIPYPGEKNNPYKWNEEALTWEKCDCI